MPKIVWMIGLLVLSNVFMTFAWYFHLKHKAWPLVMAIGVSWLIALPEYILHVPANRLGHTAFGGPFTAPQLKVIQEAITLLVFAAFSVLILKEKPRINEYIAMCMIFGAVVVAMWGRTSPTVGVHPQAPVVEPAVDPESLARHE
ncbi:MAG: hypothetical protein EA379_05565 [Phycisphaerales bacterium]|nr:MAG: hypothetical protein EA379_05565 [Phycisphaerales bacterium]